MDKAEEVARNILQDIEIIVNAYSPEETNILVNKIAAAMREYARDEIIKLFEGEDCKVAELERKAYKLGCDTMLEEAERIAVNQDNEIKVPDYQPCECGLKIADEIRRLRDKK